MRYIRTITPTEMRVINRSAILDIIRRESPISRSVIAEKLDVSLPTVMRIVDELIEEGFVLPLGIKEWSGGRRRSLIEFNAHGQVMIGVDLGGTHFYGAVADMAGQILHEAILPGARGEEAYSTLVEILKRLTGRAAETGVSIHGIGVGAPGLTDYEKGTIRHATALDWDEFPLRQRLADSFHLPVIVDNDVNLSALGELWFGVGQSARNLVLISVGTGIGAGIVIDGAIYRGSHQAAGEVGYMSAGTINLKHDYSGSGALEALAASGGIMMRSRQRLEGQCTQEELFDLGIEQVFDAYCQNEPWAIDVIEETADYLAIAVANLALCLDPDVIVLGGDLSHRFGPVVDPVMRRLTGLIPADMKLVASTLGRRAAVMGAVTNVLHQTSEFFALRSMS
jgi:glucokinase